MRVAAFQRKAVFDDPEAVICVIRDDLLWAQQHDIDIAIFPECYLQGHSYDAALVERRALSLGDPLMERLVSSGSRTTAIVGYFERRGEAVYNSAAVFQSGNLLGNYAKANPTEDGCERGTDFPVWTLGGWTLGANICGDLNYPEAADRIVAQGARLICLPLNMMLRPHKADIWRPKSVDAIQACARRTGSWVVSADVIGTNPDGWMSYGCTIIVNPDGEIVARAPELKDAVVVCDLTPYF